MVNDVKEVKIKCRYGVEYTAYLSGSKGSVARTAKMLETSCCWVCYNGGCETPKNEKLKDCGKVCELFTKDPYCEDKKDD